MSVISIHAGGPWVHGHGCFCLSDDKFLTMPWLDGKSMFSGAIGIVWKRGI